MQLVIPVAFLAMSVWCLLTLAFSGPKNWDFEALLEADVDPEFLLLFIVFLLLLWGVIAVLKFFIGIVHESFSSKIRIGP